MSTLNCDAQILDLKGKPIPQGKDSFMTIGELAQTALLAPDSKMQDGNQKASAFKLAIKLTGVVDLSLEELVAIKDAIGKIYPPLIVGRAWEILESK